MKPVRVAAEAVSELAEAAAWYESRQSGLAASFLKEVEVTQQAIGVRLLSFPRLAHPTPICRSDVPCFLVSPMRSCLSNLSTISVCLPYLTSSVVPTIGSTA